MAQDAHTQAFTHYAGEWRVLFQAPLGNEEAGVDGILEKCAYSSK